MMQRLLFAAMFLACASLAMAGEKIQVTVVDASSANYVQVRENQGNESWVRVKDVLCDELDTPYGREAKRKLLQNLRGKRVTLELGPVDDNGIRSAQIIYRNQNMNAMLLSTGLCQLAPGATASLLLKRAQRIAVARKQGRWGPVPLIETEPAATAEAGRERTVATKKRGFDNQSFFYTIAGMGFLALMIVFSRKRAVAIKRAKEEEKVAELIRERNKELGGNVVPVDLTSSVLVSPLRTAPPQTQEPSADPSRSATPHPEAGDARSSYGLDPSLLTDEDRKMLEEMDEPQRQVVIETLKQRENNI